MPGWFAGRAALRSHGAAACGCERACALRVDFALFRSCNPLARASALHLLCWDAGFVHDAVGWVHSVLLLPALHVCARALRVAVGLFCTRNVRAMFTIYMRRLVLSLQPAMNSCLIFLGMLSLRALLVPVSAARAHEEIHPVVKECQVQNFTEDAQVKAQLSQWEAKRKWEAKLAYLTTRLKQTIVDKNVPGAVAELGVLDGRTSKIFRRFLDHFAPHREFHVYDSFMGLPSRRAEDGKQVRHEDGEGGMKVEQWRFRANFRTAKLKLPDGIHQGFFKNISASEYPPEIAFAFFDGDLYSSICDSFEQVYWKMSSGGIIMVHDYTDNGLFPGAKKAIDTFLLDKPERVTECHGIVAMIVKQTAATHSSKWHRRRGCAHNM